MGLGRSIGLSLDGTDSAVLLVECRSNGANLGGGTCRENNAFGTTLGDSGRTVSDVETITGTSFIFKDGVLILANGKRLAGEKSFISFEIDGLDQSVGR